MLNSLTKKKMQEILIFYKEILNDKYAFSHLKKFAKIYALNIK